VLASTARPEHNSAEAWADARATAGFAALIAVRCAEQRHDGEPCAVRAVAEDGAARALAVARELAGAVGVEA